MFVIFHGGIFWNLSPVEFHYFYLSGFHRREPIIFSLHGYSYNLSKMYNHTTYLSCKIYPNFFFSYACFIIIGTTALSFTVTKRRVISLSQTRKSKERFIPKAQLPLFRHIPQPSIYATLHRPIANREARRRSLNVSVLNGAAYLKK